MKNRFVYILSLEMYQEFCNRYLPKLFSKQILGAEPSIFENEIKINDVIRFWKLYVNYILIIWKKDNKNKNNDK